MFAVLKTGGKQYKVAAGDVIRVEKLEGNAGQSLDLSHVMMIGDEKSAQIGEPLLANSLVRATILEQTRNKTVIIYKKRRRQGYDRKNGHRQRISLLYIDEIIQDGKSVSKAQAPAIKSKEQPAVKTKKVVTAPQKAAPKTSPLKTSAPKPKPVTQPKTASKAATKPTASTKPAAEKKATSKKPATKKTPAKKTKE